MVVRLSLASFFVKLVELQRLGVYKLVINFSLIEQKIIKQLMVEVRAKGKTFAIRESSIIIKELKFFMEP